MNTGIALSDGPIPPRHLLVLVLALVNGILYCCMLPLWEGFDEPFHYAYIQSISQSHVLPVLNRTPISQEIRRSLDGGPVSRLLSEAVQGSISFEAWSKLTGQEKKSHFDQLEKLTLRRNEESGGILNYEAQQAPLTYILYWPMDWALASLPLRSRVLWMRIAGAIASTVFLFLGLERLSHALGLNGVLRLACLTVCFEAQMLWASIAHLGNDVLAVPLTVWFLATLVIAVRRGSARDLLAVSLIFALGLLTKAYFLAFAPLMVALLIWLIAVRRVTWKAAALSTVLIVLIDAPWYGRNCILYNSFSGTQQSVAGIGLRQAVAAFPHIQWSSSALDFAFWSLWTGNWSFLSFSKNTLYLELVLLSGALVCYLLRLSRMEREEVWLLCGCLLFALGLVYQTCVTWAASQGQSTHPEPWYAQGVFAVLVVLCFRGLSLSGRLGRAIAILLLLVTAWIAALTYPVKLLPYYGAAISRSTAARLWAWWRMHPTADLNMVTLAPVNVVYAGLVCFLLLLGVTNYQLIRSLLHISAAGRTRLPAGNSLLH